MPDAAIKEMPNLMALPPGPFSPIEEWGREDWGNVDGSTAVLKPKGHSPISTIVKATRTENHKFHKGPTLAPSLAVPEAMDQKTEIALLKELGKMLGYELGCESLISDMQALGYKMSIDNQKNIEENIADFQVRNKELTKLIAAKTEKIKKASQKEKTATGFWGVLGKIAGILGGAVTAILGVAAIATGGATAAGIFMVCAGVFIIMDQAIGDLLQDKIAEYFADENTESQELIRMGIMIGRGIVSLTLGLASLGVSFYSSLPQVINNAGRILTGGLTMLKAGSTFGQSVYTAQEQWLKAEALEYERDSEFTKNEIDDILNTLKQTYERIRNNVEFVKKAQEFEADLPEKIFQKA